MFQLRILKYAWRWLSGWLIGAMVLQGLGVTFIQTLLWYPLEAEAAVVTIDSAVSTAANSNNVAGSQNVFISDLIGYTFYRDSTGQCVYRKTTNAGSTWGGPVTVDSQVDCLKIVVWYDRWTPGNTSGTFIHIATMDNSTDDLFYNRLDTSSDTLLLGSSPVNTTINSGQSPTFSGSANSHAITRATDGTVYLTASDGGDSFVVSCSTSCSSTTNWTEVGTSPLDQSNDHSLLMPLAGGEILLINNDISANDIRSKVWDGSAWSGWSTIDANSPESAVYDVSMSAAVNVDTDDVYLAYAADHADANQDDDIRTAIYSSGGWSNTTDVLTNPAGRGLHNVSLSIDQNSGDLYVAYSIEDTFGSANTASIYYKRSNDNMTTWGAEQGPVNTTATDIYGLSTNLVDYERIYATWYDPNLGDRLGETMVNIGPDTILSATGTQFSQVRASTSDFHIGGTFVLTSVSSRSLTSFEVTETGTINADSDLDNIELYYDLDTTAPYNCASESYTGGETQFGATDTDGFSGADGTATFSGSSVTVNATQSICLYVVLDVPSSATDGATIDLQVTAPDLDVLVTGETVFPSTLVALAGDTTVVSPDLTQTHFHWREDDGSEAGATSAAGAEDAALVDLAKSTPQRLRLQVSNEGSTSTDASFRLEYGIAVPTCSAVSTWTDVGATDDDWNMAPTANLTEGTDTTNIATTTGGVTDENSNFLSPNGGVRDTSSSLGTLSLDTTDFVEMEFSIVASTTAQEGETYCFRVTDNGTPLQSYSSYAEATLDADITVSAVGTHIATTSIPVTNEYFGGAFAIDSNVGAHTVTDVTVTEFGTVDGETGLENIRLYYESDTTAPYDCTSESYAGTEPQFGTTDVNGFSAANGTSTFTDSVGITTTNTLCLYVVANVTDDATTGQTVQFRISAPTNDVVAGASSVSPGTSVTISGSTTLQGGALTQTHYHWRNDDGTEASATSYTGGLEDTPVGNFPIDTNIRLRFGITNEGFNTSKETRFRLEFAPRVTTCSAVATWTDVDAVTDDSWDLFDSTNLTNGNDTTNVVVGDGGVTDENTTFLTPNGAVRDTESRTASTTLENDEHLDLEFSIKSTTNTAYSTTYCFRISAGGEALDTYDSYPELTIASKQDFTVQRGNVIISGTSTTLTAGVDYTVPNSTTTAFVRITNSHHVGAGLDSGGGRQNADDVTAYILNPDDIQSSITFARAGSADNTFVDWEIIEFTGAPGTDNEMIVRDVGTISISNTELVATGTSVAVGDDSRIVVFITGVRNENTARNYYAGQFTAEWSATTSAPVLTRGSTGGSSATLSYAVVEYTGLNWSVQRAEHAYTSAGVTETESITAVNSLTRTFLHTQKRLPAYINVDELGHTVWLSSIGAVSFRLEGGANPSGQVSVAWVIENTQTGLGEMDVQRINGTTNGGSEPLTLPISIPTPLDELTNSSVFLNTSSGGADFEHPRALSGARLTSTSTLQLWRSDTGSQLTYRSEIVSYPVADLSQRQNYYRFYEDNDTLTPTDPWPPGATDLGENTPITDADDPLGPGERLRVRMTVRISNANMPSGFQTYKLQFAERTTTCSAASGWSDLGDTASSTAWRGYTGTTTTDGDTLSSEPPLPGDLLISVADVAGTLEHENPVGTNPYQVFNGEDIEYDWYLEQNGADPETTYCFRMVKGNGATLDGYFNYPQITTAGFSPEARSWRWYDDPNNTPPNSPLAGENVTPTNINAGDTLALRLTVGEEAGITGNDVRFRLQFSDDSSFANPVDVVSTSTCAGRSLWCFTDGGGSDNGIISSSTLSDADSCTAGTGNGCGRYHESNQYLTGHSHGSDRAQEYSFTLEQANARVNAVYYFRLIDQGTGDVVPLAAGSSYPSVQTGESSLTLTVSGLPNGTSTASLNTTATTTPTTIDFGSLALNTDNVAAQRISVSTNATEGFKVLKYATQDLLNSYGVAIESVSSTNALPAAWASACTASSTGCVGYHTTDGVLEGGSTRFGAPDTYAGFSAVPAEVLYSSIASSTEADIVYRIQVSEEQPAGDYETTVIYLAVPVF